MGLHCRFCTTGDNVGGAEAAGKTIDDVVETCRAAKRESGITFVHLNGGFQGGRALELVEPFVRAIKEQVGLLVGVQLTPERVLSRYDRLIAAGVDHFSFCMELMDPAWFARVCPGKARSLGHDLFFEAMTYCATPAAARRRVGRAHRRHRTDREYHRRHRADHRAPARSRPSASSVRPPAPAWRTGRRPTTTTCARVMAAMYDACRRHYIPIGLAPNIEVSLVVNPDDAALLAPTNRGVLRL